MDNDEWMEVLREAMSTPIDPDLHKWNVTVDEGYLEIVWAKSASEAKRHLKVLGRKVIGVSKAPIMQHEYWYQVAPDVVPLVVRDDC